MALPFDSVIKRHDGEYCPTCEYPLWEKPCPECKRRADEDQATRDEWKRLIGGERAWSQYTKEKYIETQFNSAAYKAGLAFNWRKGNFLLHGPRGTGKSHLVAIMKRPLIMSGIKVMTIFMQDELRQAKENFKSKHQLEDRIKSMAMAPVLGIEDMGVEKPSAWVVNEWYYAIIDARYREAKPGLIITMNQSLAELEAQWSPFDPYGRVVSRLKEMCRGNIHSLHGERDWREE